MTSLPGQHDTTWLQLVRGRLANVLWLLLVMMVLMMTTSTTSLHNQMYAYGSSPESSYVEFLPQIKEMEEALADPSRSECPDSCDCYHTFTSRREIPGGFVLHVDCSQRGMSDFPAEIPKHAYTLDMSGNKLINITSLPRLTNLRELNLADNWLRHIDNKWVFEHSPNLRVLRLSENRLRSVQHGSFSGLDRLEELDLSMNILTSLDTHALSGLQNLKVLRLDRNQLYDFSRDWFMSLTSLIELYASHNHISVLESHVLDRLTHLQHLDVSENALRMVHREALVGLTNLKFLNLSSNTQLATLPSPAFSRKIMPRLDILLSDDTNMRRLPPYSAVNLSVTELSISFMPRLRVIEKHAIFNCTRLHNLQIHDNPLLVFLHPLSFSSLPSLKRLHIHNNGLIVVPGQIVKSLPALSDLQLDHNPLHCDCNSYWLRKELETFSLKRRQRTIGLSDVPKSKESAINSTTSDSITSSPVETIHKNSPNLYQTSPSTFIREPDRLACFFPKSQQKPPSTEPMIQLAFQYFSPTCQPSTLPLFPPIINMTLGADLTLECQGIGVPTPQMSWLLPNGNEVNSSTLNSDRDQKSSSRLQLIDDTLLKIKNVRVSDSGLYGCSASNSLGTDMTSVMLHVKNKPLDILGVEVGYDFITVALVGNIPRMELRDFQIYYKDAKKLDNLPPVEKIKGDALTSKSHYKVLRFTTHGSFHRLKIRNLKPHTEYKVCLAYKDSHLVSCKKWTTSNVLRVVQTRQGIVRVNKTQVVAAIVGSLASVVFLMLVIAFVRRRKKAANGYQESVVRRDEKASIPLDGMLLSKSTNPSLNSSRTALLSNSHL